MSEPVRFTQRPKCVKCAEERCSWRIIADDVSTIGTPPWSETMGGDILVITCYRCGWKWLMRTLDYDDRK